VDFQEKVGKRTGRRFVIVSGTGAAALPHSPVRTTYQELAGAATFSRTRVCAPLSAPRSTLAARNGFSRFWLSDGWNMLAVGDSEQHRRAIRCGTVARTIAQIF
jgi:hypothetical protein